jgi:hypothetical protein
MQILIRIQLITFMRIRIQLITLMRIRIRILPFNLMRIRIHNQPLFVLHIETASFCITRSVPAAVHVYSLYSVLPPPVADFPPPSDLYRDGGRQQGYRTHCTPACSFKSSPFSTLPYRTKFSAVIPFKMVNLLIRRRL